MDILVLKFDERVGLGTFSFWLTEQECRFRIGRADLQQLPPVGGSEPIILLGGYMGVNERDRLPYLQGAADWVTEVVENGRPLLGVCLGGQLLAHALGATVSSQTRQEKGIREINLTEAGSADPLFVELPNPFISFEWHNDSFDLPDGSRLLAQTETCPGQAFRYKNAWGLQFHPEVDEQVVTDWCQRTGAGEEPLRAFRQNSASYFAHSRQLLKNFLVTSKTLSG